MISNKVLTAYRATEQNIYRRVLTLNTNLSFQISIIFVKTFIDQTTVTHVVHA